MKSGIDLPDHMASYVFRFIKRMEAAVSGNKPCMRHTTGQLL